MLTDTGKKIDGLRRRSNILEVGLYALLYHRYPGIVEQMDLCYDPGGRRTSLDIIRPMDSGDSPKPLLIYIHGGGWVSGLRKARRFYCRRWAHQGFVCANIGYDYALDAKHPEHIRQIFRGIEYVLRRSGEFGIDPSRVAVAGESAGGYFAALLSAVTSHPQLYNLLDIKFGFKDSFRIQASVLISGIFDPVRALDTGFPDMPLFVEAFTGRPPAELRGEGDGLRSSLAPSYYTDEKFPPAFIIGSDKDRLLPESIALHQELDCAGVKNELYICKGVNGVHAGGLACHIGSGKKAVERAVRFVESQIGCEKDAVEAG